MASHDDLHFDAFRSLVTALEYHKDKFFECWRFDSRTEYVNVEFYYPVVVVQGPIMEVRSVRKGLELKDVNHNRMRQRSRRPVIQSSLEKIVNESKRLRTPEKIRAAMEYKRAGLQL